MSSNRAKNAAQMAEDIFESTVHEAAVASKAAEIIRKKEELLKAAVKDMEAVGDNIGDIMAQLREGKSVRATKTALKELVVKLQTGEATLTRAANHMREVQAPEMSGTTVEEIEEKLKTAETRKDRAKKSQAAKGSEKPGDKRGTGADAQEIDDSKDETEELRAVETEALGKVTDLLHEGGSLKTAESLSRIAGDLKKAVDAVKEAAGELNAAGSPKKDSPSKKATSAMKAIETAAAQAAEKLLTATTAIEKIVDSTQKELKQPTYDVWKAAYKKISAQAKIVDDALEASEKALERGGSSRGKNQPHQLAAYKDKINKIKREARNSYDSAMVMEELLDVREFFLAHKELIYQRLEECDRIAKNAVTNADMLFFAESLPIINGIIHVGSTREELNKATDWVRENWEGSEAQPRIVLSALLFRYVTKEGAKEFTNSVIQSKRDAWNRIDERVDRLL